MIEDKQAFLGYQYRVYANSAIPGAVVLRAVNMGSPRITVYRNTYTGVLHTAVGENGFNGTYPIGTADVAPVDGSGARGDIVYQVALPDSMGNEIGYTTDRRLKLPSRIRQPLPAGVIGARKLAFGRTMPGEISISANNTGTSDELNAILGLPVCLVIRAMTGDGGLEVSRTFIPDVTLYAEQTAPDGNAFSMVTAHGVFQALAIFYA